MISQRYVQFLNLQLFRPVFFRFILYQVEIPVGTGNKIDVVRYILSC